MVLIDAVDTVILSQGSKMNEEPRRVRNAKNNIIRRALIEGNGGESHIVAMYYMYGNVVCSGGAIMCERNE
jgi:actin-related protein